MDQLAVACFDAALEDAGVIQPDLRSALHDYFVWATTSMARHPVSGADVPFGLRIPRWGWDGLEPEP